MTKRGSLAYYMAAIVCGSFFFTLAQFLIGRESGSSSNWARDFLFAFFIGTIFGCIPQVLAAFVLRRLAGPLRWTNAWHWAVGGAGVYLLVLFVLGLLGAGFERVEGGWRFASLGLYLFGQATMSIHGGIWQALAGGALTSLVLFSVHRAFGREEMTPQKLG
jgi:hypothetical protein